MRLLLLPIVSGLLLGFGQFCMRKVAVSLPTPFVILPAIRFLLLDPFVYLFLVVNLAASVTYLGSLRYLTMTNAFAVVFVTMGATVLCLDVLVNKVTLSPLNFLGVGLGVLAVLLIALR